MKLLPLLLLTFLLFTASRTLAATTPQAFATPGPRVEKKMLLRDIEKLSGKKLSLLQKMQMRVFTGKFNKLVRAGEATPKQRRMGRLSMIFGILSLVLIFLPVISVASIPLAIAAVVLGLSSLKGNSNTEGIIGLICGSVVLFLIILAILILAALFSGLD